MTREHWKLPADVVELVRASFEELADRRLPGMSQHDDLGDAYVDLVQYEEAVAGCLQAFASGRADAWRLRILRDEPTDLRRRLEVSERQFRDLKEEAKAYLSYLARVEELANQVAAAAERAREADTS